MSLQEAQNKQVINSGALGDHLLSIHLSLSAEDTGSQITEPKPPRGPSTCKWKTSPFFLRQQEHLYFTKQMPPGYCLWLLLGSVCQVPSLGQEESQQLTD